MEIITAIEAIIEEKKDSAIQIRKIMYILERIINPENVLMFSIILDRIPYRSISTSCTSYLSPIPL